MKQYLDLLRHVIDSGEDRADRTGVGTRSVFGHQLRFNLQDGFPAVTTKKLAWKAVVSELLWFLEGSGDERRLCEILHGTRDPEKKTIWTANAQADYWKPKAKFDGDLGRVYGVNWRDWGTYIPISFSDLQLEQDSRYVRASIDQVTKLIEGIKKDPYGRRHILSAWNPAELDEMALPPCHIMSQFYVSKDKKLSCQMYQRSVDTFLGLPFNIASYALLTHIIAKECLLDVGDFVWVGGDTHIYHNHFAAVKEQLSRIPKELPTLEFEKKPLGEYTVDDFVLVDYDPYPTIKAEMAV